ncbi:MAG: dihydrofolate reductase family protein [Candidatus Doudnabacteria bacterium]
MRKIVVLEFMSLDGVIQAPGGKDEDPSDGFKFQGWTVPFMDEAGGKEMAKQMGGPLDLLLGRITYDIWAKFWPYHLGQWPSLMNATKYIVSNSDIKTTWEKTIQIKGDVASEIKKLKQGDGPMLQVYGSSVLCQTLFANDLVDELWLKIFPLTLGKGKRLFGEGTIPAAFKLLESSVTPSGVIIASYKRDGEIKLGSFT